MVLYFWYVSISRPSLGNSFKAGPTAKVELDSRHHETTSAKATNILNNREQHKIYAVRNAKHPKPRRVEVADAKIDRQPNSLKELQQPSSHPCRVLLVKSPGSHWANLKQHSWVPPDLVADIVDFPQICGAEPSEKGTCASLV